MYLSEYTSEIGQLSIVATEENLIGLWIENQQHFMRGIDQSSLLKTDNHVIIQHTKQWLDRYFNDEKPTVSELPIAFNQTNFTNAILQLLCEVKYGELITYGQLAQQYAEQYNKKSMSAQAVGNAVGRNPISIVVPCHRVVGANRQLVGYAGGVHIKHHLLTIEQSIP